ncbi:hypothetical protein BD414DRAFT_474120, partial [Trametes punicea]
MGLSMGLIRSVALQTSDLLSLALGLFTLLTCIMYPCTEYACILQRRSSISGSILAGRVQPLSWTLTDSCGARNSMHPGTSIHTR